MRRSSTFRSLIRLLDFPVKISFPYIKYKVYISFSKNASFWLSRGAAGEEREREHFRSLVCDGRFKNFYDVGANIGLYGFMFDSLAQGNIVFFEPDLDNVNLLRKTVQENRCKNVSIIECAVSDNDGQTTFYRDKLSSATGTIRVDASKNSFLSWHYGISSDEVTVGTTKLDSFSLKSFDPDIIKIDVEGAEFGVFAGALAMIERCCPVIIFECDSRDDRIQSMLSNLGYDIFDFESLVRVDMLHHNNIALHRKRHFELIDIYERATTMA
jgi:FkbM family methyltransferase